MLVSPLWGVTRCWCQAFVHGHAASATPLWKLRFQVPEIQKFPLRGRLNAEAFRRGELACVPRRAIWVHFSLKTVHEKSPKKFLKGCRPLEFATQSQSVCIKGDKISGSPGDFFVSRTRSLEYIIN